MLDVVGDGAEELARVAAEQGESPLRALGGNVRLRRGSTSPSASRRALPIRSSSSSTARTGMSPPISPPGARNCTCGPAPSYGSRRGVPSGVAYGGPAIQRPITCVTTVSLDVRELAGGGAAPAELRDSPCARRPVTSAMRLSVWRLNARANSASATSTNTCFASWAKRGVRSLHEAIIRRTNGRSNRRSAATSWVFRARFNITPARRPATCSSRARAALLPSGSRGRQLAAEPRFAATGDRRRSLSAVAAGGDTSPARLATVVQPVARRFVARVEALIRRALRRRARVAGGIIGARHARRHQLVGAAGLTTSVKAVRTPPTTLDVIDAAPGQRDGSPMNGHSPAQSWPSAAHARTSGRN